MSSDNELDATTDEQAAEHYYRHRHEIEREPMPIVSSRGRRHPP